MLKLKILSAFLSTCLLVTISSTVMAALLTNGDFEDSSSYLTGWTKSNDNVVATAYTDSPIGGSGSSLRMIKGQGNENYRGNLYQDFDFTGLGTTGLSDFQIDLDFAILGGASNEDRLFAMLTYNSTGGLVDCWDIDKETEGYELRGYYYASTTRNYDTGLHATPTTDINSDSKFDDGEIPTVNHLTLVGTGYGTADYSTTVTLNGESYTLEDNFDTSATNGAEISRILFLADSSSNTIDKDFLIDNVVVTDLSVVPQVPGDANNDGKVDGSDVTILANNWQVGVDGQTEANWEMGDFNGDKKVDGSDVTILANNWQYGVTATAAVVPEPSSIILLFGGLLCLMIRRRR